MTQRYFWEWNGKTKGHAFVKIKKPTQPQKNTLKVVIMVQRRTALYSNVIPLPESTEPQLCRHRDLG